jgi:1-acyl-sn-glycerol-3-phosphate acyltransferase
MSRLSTTNRQQRRIASTRAPRGIGNALHSFAFCIYFFGTTAVAALLIGAVRLLARAADRQGRLAHRLTCALSHHYVRLNRGWQIELEGVEHLDEHKTFVMVANHQSLIDVLVLSGLGGFFKWVAKAQVWKMLGVGQLARINDYIPVAHGDLRSVRRMMRRCRAWLERGVSIFIFPEGERSFDGRLLQFKDGPFRLACETNTPVLPIVIDGTMFILPRGGWRVNFDVPVRVKVLPPVHPREVNYDPKALNRLVKRLIAAELEGAEGSATVYDLSRPAIIDHAS